MARDFITEGGAVMREEITLTIEGMTCDRCGERVHRGLLERPGVLEATVDWCCGTATVVYDPERVQPEELLTAPIFTEEFREGPVRHRFVASLARGAEERPWPRCC
jgi:copper chaperone CopZ